LGHWKALHYTLLGVIASDELVQGYSENAAFEAEGVLPHLRPVSQQKPLVIVGGVIKDGKLRAIRDRFNIQAEWLAINNGGPKGRGICGVIILEGLIGHSVSRKIMDACLGANVPYTFAFRGGIGDIAKGFSDLDRLIQNGRVVY
jgi:hypothetical protein